MDKTLSLPRINNRPDFSKPFLTKQRKNANGLDQIEQLDSKTGRSIQNGEQKTKITYKSKFKSLKRVNSQLLRNSNQKTQNQTPKEKRYGLQQNGKISKISETTILSKVQSSDRPRGISKFQNYDKQQAAIVKKELNQITSSILILKKQIKAIEGGTLQIKEQIKNLQQNSPQQNSAIEQKIEQIKKKTQNSKYQQEVLKSMKDRLKKIVIHFQKKMMELKDTLERQERKIKILNQRSSVREESINKQKLMVKVTQQKQKTINKLTQLALQQYERKMKEANSQKEINQKANFKLINSSEYHLEIYKKQEAALFKQLKAHLFLRSFLELRWNKYSKVHEKSQKAQKLMEMHSLSKSEQQFNPSKVYYESFENKKQLQSKIRDKELKLTECMKRNNQLQKQWQSLKYKQIDQQDKIIDEKPLQIKSGKIEQKSLVEKQHRDYITDMKQKFEKSKQRAAILSRIKDWILKFQRSLEIKTSKNLSIEDRVMSIINWVIDEQKLIIKNEKS